MRTLGRPSTWIAAAIAVVVAAYVVRERTRYGFLPANDLYTYFYPKALYALASVHDGGRGLLWNPYQNCGEPFFATSQTGLLYPPYWLFLVLEPELALRGVWLVHLIIAGMGSFLLGRALGARPSAALAGALAFEGGNTMVALTISSPTHCAPFAWMPLVLLCGERLLRAPSTSRVCALGAVLAVTLLPGMPQTVFFAYQILMLRVLFELASRRHTRRAPMLLAVGIALVLPGLLAAVQLLPELEVARASVRSTELGAREISPQGSWSIELLRKELLLRGLNQPFVLVPSLLSLAGLLAPGTRRMALFYGGVGALSLVLAFGPGSVLFDLYRHLPLAGLFRMPTRFLWITSFCLAVLTALGVEALASLSGPVAWRRATAVVAATAMPLVALAGLTLNGLTAFEWSAAVLVLVAAVAAATVRRGARWTAALLLFALAIQILRLPHFSRLYLLPGPPDYQGATPVFDALRQVMSPEDRVYLLDEGAHRFMAKSATLFRVPSVLDYEPLLTRRYAEFSFMLRVGRPMTGLNDVNYLGPQLAPTFSRSLFDLAAVRYLVIPASKAPTVERIAPPLRRGDTIADLTIFENPNRLPRAFLAPRVEVSPDPRALLARLASGVDDLRQVAFVEEPPPSGFTGEPPGSAPGTVRFLRDDPEHIVFDVDAAARGFLFLSDQYFPGWLAWVDGHPVSIQRANFAFRLVEVPAGRSIVEMRYRPLSLRLGADVSGASVLAVACLLGLTRRRRASSLSRRVTSSP